MEEDLPTFQRLESIGLLAGGIAHDFNNILTTILGNISLAKMYTKSDDKVFDKLTRAEKACSQAKDLSKQLLTLSRSEGSLKKTAPIREVIKNSIDSLLGDHNGNICSLPHDIWPVQVDERQMSRVIKALILNSQEALSEGGVISVKAENTLVEKEDGLPLQTGRYVKVSVIDQGCGMSQEMLSKIFDPTFTTKQEGRGLGLPTVRAIIKRHKGFINVQSESGVGTSFLIYLPAPAN
jgi:signal transduction histidine kinase